MNTLTVLCRSAVEGNKLVGHASVFDVVTTKTEGMPEVITRSAFDDVLGRPDTDVVALVEHDPRWILGRQSAGTLRLRADDEGLAFEVDLPNTSYGNDVRELVSRGDYTGASFGFVPGESEVLRRGELLVRAHTRIEHLRDVAVVTFPAYDGAAVALRNFTHDRPDGRGQLIRARARLEGMTV